MEDCLFCKIIKGEIPSSKVFENEYVYAFNDINPVAPVHILVIPKEHICCADKVDEKNSIYIAKVFEAISQIAKNLDLKEGYRIVNNCGENAGQTVFHMHFHLIAGTNFGWPPC
ncbi:MAG: histidine triad nucleotide-binding protein [Clostridia bacterium]|nr:histidine triad nucleotide-binding protein [Clostridia bacterium]